MKLKFITFFNTLRSSYWFVPALMTLGAVLLSVGTTLLDLRLGMEWSDDVLNVFSNRPDGARTFLSTVAGSMITVAGVTFSLTILAVSYASAQYGPRILTNFMRDRSNQVTLGTFIATFLYCLLILRTVRSANESSGDGVEVIGAFVPHVSILVALVLTLWSVAVLISFFHHIPESIRLSNVVKNVGKLLIAKIDELFPTSIGTDLEGVSSETTVMPRKQAILPEHEGTRVVSDRDAYLQAIDTDELLEKTVEHDLVLELLKRPGDFVSRGTVLFRMWSGTSDAEVDTIIKKLRECYVWGSRRTATQDIMFLADQLIEVAARALSPGVNDPFTAMNCTDWLESGMAALANKLAPSAFRYDQEGNLRVVVESMGFVTVCEQVSKKLRPYLSTDRTAALYYMNNLGSLRAKVTRLEHMNCLQAQADALVDACQANNLLMSDLEEIKAARTQLFVEIRKTVPGPQPS